MPAFVARYFQRTSFLLPAWWNSIWHVKGIGVDAEFCSQAKSLIERLTAIMRPNATATYICQRCGREAKVMELEQVAFKRSVVDGMKGGTLSWSIPVCTRCDTDLPPSDITKPLLVVDGLRCDGWRRPERAIRRFLRMSFKPLAS